MSQHLLRAIERLKQDVLAVAGEVEERVFEAVQSLQTRDRALARQVVERDSIIDDMEVDVEERCLEILALHQPVADHLRFIVSVLKINNDLERIADLAVNIAERAASLATEEEIRIPFDLETMSQETLRMLKGSIDSLVRQDAASARQVWAGDDVVDAMTVDTFRQVQDRIRAEPEHLDQLIQFLSCARHLERIADLATNIAEDVIYLVEGEIVRHKNISP